MPIRIPIPLYCRVWNLRVAVQTLLNTGTRQLVARKLHTTPSARAMEVEKVGSVVVVHMKCGENRLNPNFLKILHDALDKVEAYEDATAMVTIGEGKHYSLGLDLECLATLNVVEMQNFSSSLQRVLRRLLTFPLVTVAALNGHVYAAGAILAVAHDHMVMRTDRGWFCLPEINLKRNFSASAMELVKARIPQSEHVRCILMGKRYTAEEAKAAGIIQEVSSLEKLKDSAIAAANNLAGKGLDRKTLAALKYDLYHDICQGLDAPIRYYSLL